MRNSHISPSCINFYFITLSKILHVTLENWKFLISSRNTRVNVYRKKFNIVLKFFFKFFLSLTNYFENRKMKVLNYNFRSVFYLES